MKHDQEIHDLHPFHERQLIRTGDSTSFSPLVSCDHRWMLGKKQTNWTKAMTSLGKELEDVCLDCHAGAIRNPRNGEMLEYYAPELAQMSWLKIPG